MHAHVVETVCLAADGQHNAFTDLCQWRGEWFCAYRTAQSHGITPPGHLVVCTAARLQTDGALGDWKTTGFFTYRDGARPCADLRDPKLIPSDEALYLLCGAYLPHPAHQHFQGLSAHPADNILQTMLTYTTDGKTWAPLTPILRPNYWGWSVVAGEHAYYLATYHTGRATETSSIVLWTGHALLNLTPFATIYDGANLAKDGETYEYADWTPSEPVLYCPTPDTLACCVRTEGTMALGVSRAPFQQWRWHTTTRALHPSAVLGTKHGWLLAARETPAAQSYQGSRAAVAAGHAPRASMTGLYALQGQRVTQLLRLESAGDTGYAGLAPGPTPDTVLLSYYSQHRTLHTGRFGTTPPGADVYVATIHLGA
jgi:hypothetical protein